MIRRGLPLAAVLSVLTTAGCLTSGYASKPRVAVVDNDPIVQMAPPGKLASLDDPTEVPVKKHNDPPFGKEQVVGMASENAARMYPIGLLDDYEVINDDLHGTPYVVARCALTDLTAVFDRRLGDRTLTFENSGALWRDMLVLRDRETGTYWTPATGKAIYGPLQGSQLAMIPAPVTTASAWEDLYPETVCLETGDLTAVSLNLRLYAASSWEGLSGGKIQDLRFKPKERVFFVADGGDALAFAGETVRKRKSIPESLAGAPITLEWDAALRAPRAFTQVEGAKKEIPVVPIYWFAFVLQFPGARTLAP